MPQRQGRREHQPRKVDGHHHANPGQPIDQRPGDWCEQQHRHDLGQHRPGDPQTRAGQAQHQQRQRR